MTLERLRALGEHVAAEEDRRLAERPLDGDLREILAERAAAVRGRRPVSRLALWPIAAAAALGVGAGAAVRGGAPSEEALAFTVGDGTPGALRGWNQAPATEPLALRFSDGTTIDLAPGARARVVRTDAHGADVVVESGSARVDVVPRHAGSWSVQTGPFLVEVKGTRFDLGWDALRDELALDLFEGRVVLTGCGLAQPRQVEAGERVRASCMNPAITVSTIVPPPAPRPATPPLPSVVPGPISGPTPVSSAAERADRADRADAGGDGRVVKRTSPAPAWQELARAGRYREAYEIARAGGLAAEYEGAGADDLSLLGDAARLSGHVADARAAYLALRRRFPGSPGAAHAAFALGRGASAGGDASGAARWMETVLDEQPRGALAAAAAELLLEMSLRGPDPARARAAARRYLSVLPDGPHASEARRVAGEADPPRDRK